MTSKVVRIGVPPGQPDIADMIEALRVRAQNGLVIGLALVEHREGDEVAIEVCGPVSYHHLNSGAARLAHMLAAAEQESP